MKRIFLFLFVFVSTSFSLDGLSLYWTVKLTGDTVTVGRMRYNNDSIVNWSTEVADSFNYRIPHWKPTYTRDSIMQYLNVDSIRHNPDIDSIRGNPFVDSIKATYGDFALFDTINATYGNFTLFDTVKTSAIRGNPDVDSLKGSIIMDTLTIDSVRISKASIDTVSKFKTTTITLDTLKASSANGLKINDDGGNGIFIKDSGNVGIGTSTPLYTLEITKNKAAETSLAVFNNNSSGSAHLRVGYDSTFHYDIYRDGSSSNIIHNNTQSGNLLWQVQAVELMRLTNSSGLGLGTATPLTVNGVVYTASHHLNVLSTTKPSRICVEGSSSGQLMLTDRGAPANYRTASIISDGGYLQLNTINDAGSGLTKAVIDLSTGYVGIDTTSPGSKLHVAGSIRARDTVHANVISTVKLDVDSIIHGNVVSSDTLIVERVNLQFFRLENSSAGGQLDSIYGDSLIFTRSSMCPVPENPAATRDTITIINNPIKNSTYGDLVILRGNSVGDTITVKKGGNLQINSDFELNTFGDVIVLMYYNYPYGSWYEISRSDND